METDDATELVKREVSEPQTVSLHPQRQNRSFNVKCAIENTPTGKISLVTKFSIYTPGEDQNRQTEPPQQDTIEYRLPTISFPSVDPSQLQSIDLSSVFQEEASSSSGLPSSQRSHQLPRYHLRWTRQQALSRIGINFQSREKRLLAAVRNNDICGVIHLLENGVSPNVSDTKKRTPLHIASSQGLDRIVSSLTAMRADPNRVDILGNTPLHLAVCRGDTRVVVILIGSGADIHMKDKTGKTSLDIVKSRLNMLRQDKTISSDKLIGECRMISELLKIQASRIPNHQSSDVDALCDMMAGVSTREQADQLADNMMNQMAVLTIKTCPISFSLSSRQTKPSLLADELKNQKVLL